jgi:hypothetical protein
MNKITGKKPGPGRPKGSRNKVTGIAKDIIAEAADRLGGVERLVAWSKEDAQNERAFWSTIFPKLMPLQVAGELDHNVKVSGALSWNPPQ